RTIDGHHAISPTGRLRREPAALPQRNRPFAKAMAPLMRTAPAKVLRHTGVEVGKIRASTHEVIMSPVCSVCGPTPFHLAIAHCFACSLTSARPGLALCSPLDGALFAAAAGCGACGGGVLALGGAACACGAGGGCSVGGATGAAWLNETETPNS